MGTIIATRRAFLAKRAYKAGPKAKSNKMGDCLGGDLNSSAPCARQKACRPMFETVLTGTLPQFSDGTIVVAGIAYWPVMKLQKGGKETKPVEGGLRIATAGQ